MLTNAMFISPARMEAHVSTLLADTLVAVHQIIKERTAMKVS